MINLLALSLTYREQYVRSYLSISCVKLDSPFLDLNGQMQVVLFVLYEVGDGLSTPSCSKLGFSSPSSKGMMKNWISSGLWRVTSWAWYLWISATQAPLQHPAPWMPTFAFGI